MSYVHFLSATCRHCISWKKKYDAAPEAVRAKYRAPTSREIKKYGAKIEFVPSIVDLRTEQIVSGGDAQKQLDQEIARYEAQTFPRKAERFWSSSQPFAANTFSTLKHRY